MYQLPVIAIWCTSKHIGVICCTQPICCCDWSVISEVRSQAHTALSSVITPRHSWLNLLIHGLMNQYSTTCQTSRSFNKRQVIENYVTHVFDLQLRVEHLEIDFLLGGHQRVSTITLYGYFRSTTHYIHTAPAQYVIPHCLQCFIAVATVQNWERVTAEGVFHTRFSQHSTGGIVFSFFINKVWRRGSAATLINVQLERLWIGTQQTFDTFRQLVSVLSLIIISDGE